MVNDRVGVAMDRTLRDPIMPVQSVAGPGPLRLAVVPANDAENARSSVEAWPDAATQTLRNLLVGPSWRLLGSTFCILWVSYVQNATDLVVCSLVGIVVLLVMDTILGQTRALVEGKWSRTKATHVFIKVIVYMAAGLAFLTIAGVLDAKLSTKGTIWTYRLMELLQCYLCLTEFRSVIEHANILTGGKCAPLFKWFGGFADKLRAQWLNTAADAVSSALRETRTDPFCPGGAKKEK